MGNVSKLQAVTTDVDELHGLCVHLDMQASDALKHAEGCRATEDFERDVYLNQAREYLIMRHALIRLIRNMEEFEITDIKVQG